jgi:hypothetical protein
VHVHALMHVHQSVCTCTCTRAAILMPL